MTFMPLPSSIESVSYIGFMEDEITCSKESFSLLIPGIKY